MIGTAHNYPVLGAQHSRYLQAVH